MFAQVIPLRCSDCGHQWEERLVLPMRMTAFLARLRAWAYCPNCGAYKKQVVFSGSLSLKSEQSEQEPDS